MTSIELNRQEIAILIGWAEEACKGKFSLGDDISAITWEEGELLRKLRQATGKKSAKRGKT